MSMYLLLFNIINHLELVLSLLDAVECVLRLLIAEIRKAKRRHMLSSQLVLTENRLNMTG